MSQTENAPAASTEAPAALSLLDEIVEATRLKPGDDGFAATRDGLQAFLKELVAQPAGETKVSPALVDSLLADLDKRLSSQVNAIMHNEQFQKLERAWRGLKYLVDNTDFRQNIKIEFISVSKEDLLTDFQDAPEIMSSGLYKHIYTAEYGQFGGQPVGPSSAITNSAPARRIWNCSSIWPRSPPCRMRPSWARPDRSSSVSIPGRSCPTSRI